MHKYFFTVIVPVYNVENYLKTCLDSIMDQTFRDYEVIVIDDGSTDSSSSICDNYLSHNNVTIIHQENHGLPQTRQLGLERAQGEYINFIDADDWLDENHLEVRYKRLKDSGIEMLWSAYHNHKYESSYVDTPSLSISSPELLILRYQNKISSYVWNNTYQRKFLERNNIHFGRYTIGEDYFFITQVFYYVRHIAFDECATYHYRYNPQSLTNKRTKESRIKYYCEVLGNLKDENDLLHFSENKEIQSSFYFRVNEIKRGAIREFYQESALLESFLDYFPESFHFLKVKSLKDIGLYLACRFRCYLFYRVRGWLKVPTT